MRSIKTFHRKQILMDRCGYVSIELWLDRVIACRSTHPVAIANVLDKRFNVKFLFFGLKISGYNK